MNCAQEFQRTNYSGQMLTYAMDDDSGSWWWWINIIGKNIYFISSVIQMTITSSIFELFLWKYFNKEFLFFEIPK